AVHCRCVEADLHAFAVQDCELTAAGTRLQMTMQDQILAIPAPGAGQLFWRVHPHQRKGLSIAGMPVAAASSPSTKRSIRFSVIKAKIGEMSSPPRFGSRRRNGSSNGSQICWTSCAPGLWLPCATHERITLMISAKKNTLM